MWTVATVFVVIAGLSSTPSAVAAPGAAEAVARIDRRLTTAAADGSGYAIIVERKGAVILRRGDGLANRATREPFTTDTIAQIGSITKQFTAAAALTLVQRGALDLGAPVKTYLPAAPAAIASVTLHQLMTHTAGLPVDCGAGKTFYPRCASDGLHSGYMIHSGLYPQCRRQSRSSPSRSCSWMRTPAWSEKPSR